MKYPLDSSMTHQKRISYRAQYQHFQSRMTIKIPASDILSGFFRSVTLLSPLKITLDDALGHLTGSNNSLSTQNFEIDCCKLDKELSSFDYSINGLK